MRIVHRIPKPPLDDYVECLWMADEMTGSHTWERVLPNGSMQLLVDPFGHHWTIATHIEDVPPEEIERRNTGK